MTLDKNPTDWKKEFDNLPLEKRDVYPPREESCKICRDYSNHAHGPSQEAIGYNQCLEKIIPVFKSFIRTKIQQAKEEGRKEVEEATKAALSVPMGVSAWMNHGIKFSYDKFFGIDLEKLNNKKHKYSKKEIDGLY